MCSPDGGIGSHWLVWSLTDSGPSYSHWLTVCRVGRLATHGSKEPWVAGQPGKSRPSVVLTVRLLGAYKVVHSRSGQLRRAGLSRRRFSFPSLFAPPRLNSARYSAVYMVSWGLFFYDQLAWAGLLSPRSEDPPALSAGNVQRALDARQGRGGGVFGELKQRC